MSECRESTDIREVGYCAVHSVKLTECENMRLRKSLEEKDRQLLEAEAQNAELREVVKSLEWAASVWEDACDDCPEEENGGMCMECFAHHHAGHERDCKLNKVLSKTSDPSKMLEEYKREIESGVYDGMVAYCRKERRDICGKYPQDIIGDLYKTGRHDGMGALMAHCEKLAEAARKGKEDGG